MSCRPQRPGALATHAPCCCVRRRPPPPSREQAAQHSLAHATARYAAARGALSLLGPLMWGWLAADLALKAIGTDYARVVRAVFILAQVRGPPCVGVDD